MCSAGSADRRAHLEQEERLLADDTVVPDPVGLLEALHDLLGLGAEVAVDGDGAARCAERSAPFDPTLRVPVPSVREMSSTHMLASMRPGVGRGPSKLASTFLTAARVWAP